MTSNCGISAVSPYADENVPPPGDTKSEMRWYWEPGISEIPWRRDAYANFDLQASQSSGRRLTASNLEHLRWQREARDEYSSTQEVAELAELTAAASSTAKTSRDPR
jgi:hypothetical protein